MIVANRKPFDEIMEMLRPYTKILLIGCNECVTVCSVGGAKEVEVLASEIRLARGKEGVPVEIKEHTLERQCDPEYVEQIKPFVDDYEIVISIACGCGVQSVADIYKTKYVVPGVNTTFMGSSEEQGVWKEMCQGCGNCVLDKTLGLCPVARCAKSLFNGPCGGSQVDGSCEINKDVPCVWQLIVQKMKDMNMLDKYMEIQPMKNWSTARDGGPRKRIREDLKI
jgi:ferredoxin